MTAQPVEPTRTALLSEDEPPPGEARAAVREALRNREEAYARRGKVESLAEELRAVRERNHFVGTIEQALGLWR